MPAWSGWAQRGRPVRAETCEGPQPPVQTEQQLQRPREEQSLGRWRLGKPGPGDGHGGRGNLDLRVSERGAPGGFRGEG